MKQLPLKALAQEFTDIASEQRILEDKILRGYGQELLRNIVFATPVKTGRARANWVVSTARPSLYKNTDESFSFQESFDFGLSFMEEITARQEIFIVNNLDYIQRLNNGWSAQAPAAFVENTVDTVTDALPQIARRIIQNGR